MSRKVINTSLLPLIVAITLVAHVVPAAATQGIDGMITPFAGGNDTYVAVPLSLDKGASLASLRWYNNDGSTALPEVSIVRSAAKGPDLGNALYSEEHVYGSSDAWTQLDLPIPIAIPDEAVWAVFRIPAVTRSSVGVGGGPGIGYLHSQTPSTQARVSADGQDWVRLAETLELAVQFETTSGLSKSAPAPATEGDDGSTRVHYRTGLGTAFPNPANPSMSIRFTMKEAGDAHIAVYNVRGQRVATLLDQWVPTGEHGAQWLGTDENGRQVSSGVYYVQFQAHDVKELTRVTIVR